MVVRQGLFLELGHETIAAEEWLGDHLLVPSARDLAEEAAQAKFTLDHLVDRPFKRDRAGVLGVVEEGFHVHQSAILLFLGAQANSPSGSEVVEAGPVVFPSACREEVIQVLVPLGVPVLRSER